MSDAKDDGTVHDVPKPARVAIDPGHGGSNQGCQYPGLSEKAYALGFAACLAERLQARGCLTTLTRTQDMSKNFTERASVADVFKADLAISIHVNASTNPQARGFQVYYMPDDLLAVRLAHAINERIPEKMKRRTYAVIPASLDGLGDDAVLRRYKMPAVLLELGFASNAEDRAYLLSELGKEQLAAAIATGVQKYLADLPA